jgi:hypothetical protein
MRAAFVVAVASAASCGRGDTRRSPAKAASSDVVATSGIRELAVLAERACWTSPSTDGSGELNGLGVLSCVQHDEAKPRTIAGGVVVDSPLVGDARALYAVTSGAIVAFERPSEKPTVVYPLPGDPPAAMALTSSELIFEDPSEPVVRALARSGGAIRDLHRGADAIATSMQVGGGHLAWSHPGDPSKGGDESVLVVPITGGPPRTVCRGAVDLVAVDESNVYCRHAKQLIAIPLPSGEARPAVGVGAMLQQTPTGEWTWYAATWSLEKSEWTSDDLVGFGLRVGSRPGDPDATVVVSGLSDAWRYEFG